MARPRKKIDANQVEALAGINCTVAEIASVLQCSKDTLERRYAANIKKGRDQGRSSLRRMMWEKAKTGNVTMMIWLSKQILGYADKVTQKVETTEPVTINVQWADDDNTEDASPDASTKEN